MVDTWEILMAEIEACNEARDKLVSLLLKTHEDKPIVLKHANSDTRGLVITPSAKEKNKIQGTTFDEKGFVADFTETTLQRAIEEALNWGYNQLAPDLLDQLGQTPQFLEGTIRTLEAQREWNQQRSLALETREPAESDVVAEEEPFEAWFRQSKVVKNGEPLIVFHGTPEGGFEEFSHDKKGIRTGHEVDAVGFHFTDSREYAESYSLEYLREFREKLVKQLGYIPDAFKVPEKAMTYEVYLSLQNPLYLDKSREITAESIRQAVENGFDGIIASHGGGTEYVAFYPEQIKSATNNRGTYDWSNPNILYSGFDPTFGRWNDISVEDLLKPFVNDLKIAIPLLVDLGKHAYNEGYQTPRRWLTRMQSYLGSAWNAFKAKTKQVYYSVTKCMRMANKLVAFGLVGCYGGVAAATVNQDRLATAQSLAALGENNESIREKVGWFQGVDGRWRFEIDDSKAQLQLPDSRQLQSKLQTLKSQFQVYDQKDEAWRAPARSLRVRMLQIEKQIQEMQSKTNLGVLLKHSSLYKAYPELKQIGVYFDAPGMENGDAHYNRTCQSIHIKSALKTDPDLLRLVLHEVQHAIQHIEGFARGGSPETVTDGVYNPDPFLVHAAARIVDQMAAWDKAGISISLEHLLSKPPRYLRDDVELIQKETAGLFFVKNPDRLRLAQEDLFIHENRELAYRRLAGEIEAYDVARRAYLSRRERKTLQPELPENAIVKFSGNTAACFAGVSAATASKLQLNKAITMAKQGEPAESIRSATGWYQGMEGQWRFEIDDSQAALKDYSAIIGQRQDAYSKEMQLAIARSKEEFCNPETPVQRQEELVKEINDLRRNAPDFGNFKASEILQHDALYAAYPWLQEIPVSITEMREGHSGVTQGNHIILNSRESKEEQFSTLLHEVQHVIQDREGFAPGGTASLFYERDKKYGQLMAEHQQNLDLWGKDISLNETIAAIVAQADAGEITYLEVPDRIREYIDHSPVAAQIHAIEEEIRRLRELRSTPTELYNRLAGEIESEDVVARMAMTASERACIAPELREDAIVLDNTVTGGVSAAYAGIRAETADKASLLEAKKKIEQGLDPEVVRQETGWFQGMDKNWRYEIDDSQATVNAKTISEATQEPHGSLLSGTSSDNQQPVCLSKILDHPHLYEAYPFLKDIAIEVKSDANGKGAYLPEEDKIILDAKFAKEDLSEGQPKTLLHEIQHAIQGYEGFARGDTPEEFLAKDVTKEAMKKIHHEISEVLSADPVLGKAYRELNELGLQRSIRDLTDEEETRCEKLEEIVADHDPQDFLFEQMLKLYHLQDNPIVLSPEEQYRRLAGEIESRDVSNRSELSKKERNEEKPVISDDATVERPSSRISAILEVEAYSGKMKQDPNAAREYKNQAKAFFQEGTRSKVIDRDIVFSMLQKGYEQQKVINALNVASPFSYERGEVRNMVSQVISENHFIKSVGMERLR